MGPEDIGDVSWEWLMIILMLMVLSAAAAYHPRRGFSGSIFIAAMGINGALAIYFGKFEQAMIIIPIGLFILLFYAQWQGGSDHHE